ncbi:hypothetical protein PPERSA_01861 [Pseudocohnilembus persalinus]|uniref:Armadillo-type fold n=1 Tax=Pseudocohnilembus persalinus TaxID=266149 RepID=A0A0V0R2U8_PSEPJ|nr:hypothetical protein PPERSA_01861 [Pseudocohnilembus persalinus]|eukprot:KRX08608.1 hypothetical protein PPERSA_01861 [Pseudocohnilembus persalinus]
MIDFSGKSIKNVSVNGNTIKETEMCRKGVFLFISEQNLKLQQKNQIVVEYQCNYDNDGSGLQSFIDTDGLQYIYSQAFLFYANRFIPCFDQPDLKANFQLTIQTPSDWLAISNSKEAKKASNLEENYTVYQFEETPLIPTYLFGFIAGPFSRIEIKEKFNGIDMGIYCRSSLEEHVQKLSEMIFEITIESMKFYEELFQCKFAFQKYDQIFCPEFNWGAMENISMVIYTDAYVFKEKVESSRLIKFCNTISHELSHHWFGNLVTMKWWKDLWLNESFADFISHFCLDHIKNKVKSIDLENIWAKFNARKEWAYQTDEKNTTHCIAGECHNTEQADGLLDGITYTKGASVLRQLISFLEEKTFSEAMKTYFEQFSFKNASLEQFIQHLDIYFQQKQLEKEDSYKGFSLNQWKQEWLCTEGPNNLEILDFQQNGRKVQFKVKQTAFHEQRFNYLRNHIINIGYFGENGKVLTQEKVKISSQEITEINYQIEGKEEFQIQAVLLNIDDLGYCRVQLDNLSLQYFKLHTKQVKNQLTRCLIWGSLFNMIRDAKITAVDFWEFIKFILKDEENDSIISGQLINLDTCINDYTPKENQKDLKYQVFEYLYQWIMEIVGQDQISEKNEHVLLVLKKQIITFIGCKQHADIMLDWFQNKIEKLQEHKLGGSNMWSLVYSLLLKDESIINREMKIKIQEDLLENLKFTEWSIRIKNLCQAVLANEEQKGKLYINFLDQNYQKSVKDQSYEMQGFLVNKIQQEEYCNLFFQDLVRVFEERGRVFAKTFYQDLLPEQFLGLQNLKNKLECLLQELKKSNKVISLQKLLVESLDSINQRIKAHQKFASQYNK